MTYGYIPLQQSFTDCNCFRTLSHLSVRGLQGLLAHGSHNFMSQNHLQIADGKMMGQRRKGDLLKAPELSSCDLEIQSRDSYPRPCHFQLLVTIFSRCSFCFCLKPMKNPDFLDVCPPRLTFLDSFPQPFDNCPRQMQGHQKICNHLVCSFKKSYNCIPGI